jgi:pimeloyl-ACP methyl ester carboxylesterase
LICADSHADGSDNLADKELAVLIHEVATKGKSSPPHIVISLDCCHSGSGTRSAGEDVEWGTRAAPSSGRTRTLESYADGFYTNQPRLEVPSSKHVLLSACKSIQRAGDLPKGGAFTSGFIKALRDARGNISYADLFLRARSSVQHIRDNQTPQFETLENFDPYTRFLEGTPSGDRDLYEVLKKDGTWYVRCGAIHGLPTNPKSPIQLDIWSAPPEKKEIGTATIKSVGAQMSPIDFEGSFELGHFFRALIPGDEAYMASVRHLPAPPAYVALSGEAEVVAKFKADERIRAKNILWASPDDVASIEVIANDGRLVVMDLDKNRKAFVTEGQSPEHIQVVIDALAKIVHWRRIIDLENHNSQSRVADMVRLEIHVYDEDGNVQKYPGEDMRLYANSRSIGNRFPAFLPVVHLNNVQQPLCFYLLFVAYDYSISCPGEEIIYRPDEHDDLSHVEIPLWKKTLGWGPAKSDAEDTCHFKLLVTTEQLDHQQFLQSGLGVHRSGILGEPTPHKVFDDWAAITAAITITRQDQTLSASQDVSLADGNIKIKAHTSVSANISIGHVERNSRAGGDAQAFGLLQGKHTDLFNFNTSRSALVQNIIELNDVHIADESALHDEPLEITLPGQTDDKTMLLPVAFDGKYFRVIGDSVSDGSGTTVYVREIPAPADDMQERGLLRSLKMTFCKVALNTQDVNQLHWVEFLDDGTAALRRESLGIKAGKAKRILLVLHGLGGDAHEMVQTLNTNLPADKLKSYDLILAYDYESLNTGLDDTARSLKAELMGLNIGKDGRKITIIGHSLGGLVARWLTEKEGGNAFVENCILIGTPNNGSAYGKIDAYRQWAQGTLELALNFIPNVVPFSGFVLKFLKTASDLSGSIAQLDPASKFINDLNSSSDPGVQYTVIAGDAAGMDSGTPGFSSFLQQTRLKLGKWMNSDEPNDLFAPVRSLECPELWEGREAVDIKPTMQCHHFSYLSGVSGTRSADNVWKVLNEVL